MVFLVIFSIVTIVPVSPIFRSGVEELVPCTQNVNLMIVQQGKEVRSHAVFSIVSIVPVSPGNKFLFNLAQPCLGRTGFAVIFFDPFHWSSCATFLWQSQVCQRAPNSPRSELTAFPVQVDDPHYEAFSFSMRSMFLHEVNLEP